MSLDILFENDRKLYIDRDPEEGFILIGAWSRTGGGVYLSKEEVLEFYQALSVELQIKGVIEW